MSFNYESMNLEALAALPVKCNCDDKQQIELLKDGLLFYLWDGKIKTVFLGKMKWKLEPIGDHEIIRKDGNERANRGQPTPNSET